MRGSVEDIEDDSVYDRKVILLDHIVKIPGIRYRELLKRSGFSNGVLFYHLTGLEQAGLIRVERKQERNTTRYYPKDISEMESTILSYLRHPPQQEIILFILEKPQCTLADIMKHTEKAISTISAQLNYLKQERIVSTRRTEQLIFYSLANPELVAGIASKYKLRLIDKSKNNFFDMVDKL
jgi:predicted transcriptional regulator